MSLAGQLYRRLSTDIADKPLDSTPSSNSNKLIQKFIKTSIDLIQNHLFYLELIEEKKHLSFPTSWNRDYGSIQISSCRNIGHSTLMSSLIKEFSSKSFTLFFPNRTLMNRWNKQHNTPDKLNDVVFRWGDSQRFSNNCSEPIARTDFLILDLSHTTLKKDIYQYIMETFRGELIIILAGSPPLI